MKEEEEEECFAKRLGWLEPVCEVLMLRGKGAAGRELERLRPRWSEKRRKAMLDFLIRARRV